MLNNNLLHDFYEHLQHNDFKIHYTHKFNKSYFKILNKNSNYSDYHLKSQQSYIIFKEVFPYLISSNNQQDFIDTIKDYITNTLKNDTNKILDIYDFLEHYQINSLFIIDYFKSNKEKLLFLFESLYINNKYDNDPIHVIDEVIPFIQKQSTLRLKEIDSLISDYLAVAKLNINNLPKVRDSLLKYYLKDPFGLIEVAKSNFQLQSILKSDNIDNSFILSKTYYSSEINISLKELQSNYYIDYFNFNNYSVALQLFSKAISKQEKIDFTFKTQDDYNKENDEKTIINITFHHCNQELYTPKFFIDRLTYLFKHLKNDSYINDFIDNEYKDNHIIKILPNLLLQFNLSSNIKDNNSKADKIKI